MTDIEMLMERFCQDICVHYNPDPKYTCEACQRCDVKAFVGWVVDESSLTTREDYQEQKADEEYHRIRDERLLPR